MMGAETGRLGAFIRGLVVFLFFSAVFFSLALPLATPDLWWHLATGRWMWENGSLMGEDPFNFVSFPSDSARWRSLVLKQYWLSQLGFYGTYGAAGYMGIVVMAALVLTGMFYTVWRLAKRAGAGPALSLPLIFLAWLVIVKELGYVEARPQMWSSLFSVLVILLLEQARAGKKGALYALPPFMLLWANMHGGFALGVVIIATYLLVALLERRRDRPFYVSLASAMLLSGANPNGFAAFLIMADTFVNVEAVRYWGAIVESQSLFAHAPPARAMMGMPYLSALVAVSALSFLINAGRIRQIKPELALLYLLALFMGFKSIRHIPFFALVAAYASAVNLRLALSGLERWRPVAARAGGFKAVRAALALPLLALAFYTVVGHGARYTALRGGRTYVGQAEGAARFIKENGLKGNVFNDYNDGGYLIWRLWPDIKVFADGRGLSYEGFDLYKQVSNDPMSPSRYDRWSPAYMSAFWGYGIDLVVMAGADRTSGVTIPLSYILLNDHDWSVVYADAAVLVFMRNTEENAAFRAARALPKSAGYSNILAIARAAAGGGRLAHRAPGQKLSMAVGHMGRGEKEEAMRWMDEYLRLRPNDQNALRIKERIERQ